MAVVHDFAVYDHVRGVCIASRSYGTGNERGKKKGQRGLKPAHVALVAAVVQMEGNERRGAAAAAAASASQASASNGEDRRRGWEKEKRVAVMGGNGRYIVTAKIAGFIFIVGVEAQGDAHEDGAIAAVRERLRVVKTALRVLLGSAYGTLDPRRRRGAHAEAKPAAADARRSLLTVLPVLEHIVNGNCGVLNIGDADAFTVDAGVGIARAIEHGVEAMHVGTRRAVRLANALSALATAISRSADPRRAVLPETVRACIASDDDGVPCAATRAWWRMDGRTRTTLHTLAQMDQQEQQELQGEEEHMHDEKERVSVREVFADGMVPPPAAAHSAHEQLFVVFKLSQHTSLLVITLREESDERTGIEHAHAVRALALKVFARVASDLSRIDADIRAFRSQQRHALSSGEWMQASVSTPSSSSATPHLGPRNQCLFVDHRSVHVYRWMEVQTTSPKKKKIRYACPGGNTVQALLLHFVDLVRHIRRKTTQSSQSEHDSIADTPPQSDTLSQRDMDAHDIQLLIEGPVPIRLVWVRTTTTASASTATELFCAIRDVGSPEAAAREATALLAHITKTIAPIAV